MPVSFSTYSGQTGYTDDYFRVSDLLFRIGQQQPRPGLIDWVFWEWSTARDAYKADDLAKIGLWEDQDRMVAATVIEDHMGAVSIVADAEHRYLRPDLLCYACEHMAHDGVVAVIIDDCDRELQRLAFQAGLRPTQQKECTALLDITQETTRYALPYGFRILSFDRNSTCANTTG